MRRYPPKSKFYVAFGEAVAELWGWARELRIGGTARDLAIAELIDHLESASRFAATPGRRALSAAALRLRLDASEPPLDAETRDHYQRAIRESDRLLADAEALLAGEDRRMPRSGAGQLDDRIWRRQRLLDVASAAWGDFDDGLRSFVALVRVHDNATADAIEARPELAHELVRACAIRRGPKAKGAASKHDAIMRVFWALGLGRLSAQSARKERSRWITDTQQKDQ
jgi:hypothetical protein